ncbi:MAG: DUF6173 family protein [Pseudomonadota bacterium]
MTDDIKTTAEAVEGAMLAELYAVQVNEDGHAQAENHVTGGAGPGDISKKSPAEWAYERIVMYIQKFEETLDADQEVGMGYAGGEVGSLRIEGMGFFGPDIITFYGEAPDGSKTQLIQHVSQLNVMLVAAPKENEEAEPRRIGFKLQSELEEKRKS